MFMKQMVKLLERFDLPEMFTESYLERVHFFKSKYHIPRTPLIYNPGIFIVAQGRKKAIYQIESSSMIQIIIW